jgi:hypothetical protein
LAIGEVGVWDACVVGFGDAAPVVGSGLVSAGFWGDRGAGYRDRGGPPGSQVGAIVRGGVGDSEGGDLRGAVPQPQGGLGVAAEDDDGLQPGVGDEVVEAVAPGKLVRVFQQREGLADLAGVDGEGKALTRA